MSEKKLVLFNIVFINIRFIQIETGHDIDLQ